LSSWGGRALRKPPMAAATAGDSPGLQLCSREHAHTLGNMMFPGSEEESSGAPVSVAAVTATPPPPPPAPEPTPPSFPIPHESGEAQSPPSLLAAAPRETVGWPAAVTAKPGEEEFSGKPLWARVHLASLDVVDTENGRERRRRGSKELEWSHASQERHSERSGHGTKRRSEVIVSALAALIARTVASVSALFLLLDADSDELWFFGVLAYVISLVACFVGLVTFSHAGPVRRGCLVADGACSSFPCLPWALAVYGVIGLTMDAIVVAIVGTASFLVADGAGNVLLAVFGSAWLWRLRGQTTQSRCSSAAGAKEETQATRRGVVGQQRFASEKVALGANALPIAAPSGPLPPPPEADFRVPPCVAPPVAPPPGMVLEYPQSGMSLPLT